MPCRTGTIAEYLAHGGDCVARGNRHMIDRTNSQRGRRCLPTCERNERCGPVDAQCLETRASGFAQPQAAAAAKIHHEAVPNAVGTEQGQETRACPACEIAEPEVMNKGEISAVHSCGGAPAEGMTRHSRVPLSHSSCPHFRTHAPKGPASGGCHHGRGRILGLCWYRYPGQSHPRVPAVTSAYTRPSTVDFKVVLHARLYQIEFCQRASA